MIGDSLKLSELKVGSDVVVVTHHGWANPTTYPTKVAKILKPYIELEDGRRYKILKGYMPDGSDTEIGRERKSPQHQSVSGYNGTTLVLAGDPRLKAWALKEEKDQAHRKARARVKSIDNRHVSVGDIDQAIDALEQLREKAIEYNNMIGEE